MGLGAVVAIGSREQGLSEDVTASNATGSGGVHQTSWPGSPLGCIELLGRSMVERTVERFVAIDVDCVSVLVEAGNYLPPFRNTFQNVTVEVVSDLNAAIAQRLQEHAQRGIDHSFINWGDTYAETDLLDLFCFHRESRQLATPTFDKEGDLDLWVVNCGNAQGLPFATVLDRDRWASRYFLRGYVKRLTHPRDLRQISADILQRRCETAPSGRQVRPGVWTDQGADVHRRARIVAPAYIGCGSKVRADALITRLSNIERDCCIESGTVVEDTTILPNTIVGICLDLCHAVVSGNNLFNLERDVMIEVADPEVMRSTATAHRPFAGKIDRSDRTERDPDSRKLHPISEWQFDGNLIQE